MKPRRDNIKQGLKIAAILLSLLGLAYFLGSLWSVPPVTHLALDDPIETLSWQPRIFRYKNFITSEEADYLRELGTPASYVIQSNQEAAPLVTRSEVVAAPGESSINEARTSSGVFLGGSLGEDPLVKKIGNKIALWTQIPEGHGEAFYVIRYEKGQQYRPHMDWFDNTTASIPYLGQSGQRVATVLTYLATPESGGETIFPDAQGGPLITPATKGDAVLFWNVLPDGTEDPKSLHGGRPIIAGTKWCMTRWIRKRNF